MATSIVSISALITYLRSGKDVRKDAKNFLKLLNDVHADAWTSEWQKSISTTVLDSLIEECLVKLQSSSVTERECISLIHRIASKAILPVELPMTEVKPAFMFERIEVEEASIVSPQADAWYETLTEKEILGHPEDNLRRILALQTLGDLAEAGQLQPISKSRLGEICRQMLLTESALSRVAAPIQQTDKTSGSSNILLRPLKRPSSNLLVGFESKEDERNVIALCEASLICARKSLPESAPALLDEAAVALGSVRGEVCRLAMAFYLRACLFDIQQVAREFNSRLPVAPGTIDLSDSVAARDFARIMLATTSSPHDKSFHALALLLRDPRPAVYVLACQLLAQTPWHWLLSHKLPSQATDKERSSGNRRPSSADGVRLVPEMVYRLTEALGSSKDAIALAACEAVARLARTRCEWIAEDIQTRATVDDPFFPLTAKLASLCIESGNRSLRIEASVAMCWVGKPTSLAYKLRADRDCTRLVDSLVVRAHSVPSVDLSACLLQVLWNSKSGVGAAAGERALAACLASASRETSDSNRRKILGFTNRHLLSLIDWASDTENAEWLAGLLGLVATKWPFDESTPIPTARGLLFRLERSLKLSTDIGVRREAASALVKIAVVLGEPIRVEAYEIMQDFFIFSKQYSFERDHSIRSELIGPALAMLDRVYELLIAKQGDSNKYESANRTAMILCAGLPSDFSFLFQAQQMLQAATGNKNKQEAFEDRAEEDEEDDSSHQDSENDEDLPHYKRSSHEDEGADGNKHGNPNDNSASVDDEQPSTNPFDYI